MLNQGIYLKELLKKYKLTQNVVAGGIIDRSRISKVNTGESSLSEEISKKIADNIIKKVGNKLEEDPEYLYLYFYNHQKYQAIMESKIIISKLEDYFNRNKVDEFFNHFRMLDNIFLNNDLPEIKVKVFEMAAKICRNNHDYTRAYSYASRAIDNAERLGLFDVKIINYVIKIQVLNYSNKYDHAIYTCNCLLNKYRDKIKELHYLWILNNLAYAYEENKQYDEALKQYTIIKSIITDVDQITDITTHMALCYFNQKKYKQSIDILTSLKLEGEYTNQHIKVYDTFLTIYLKMSDKSKIEEYAHLLEIALPHMKSILQINNYHVSKLYFNLAEAYMFLGNTSYAEFYYQHSMDQAKSKNDIQLQGECIMKLYKIYLNNDKNKINLLIGNLSSLLTNNAISPDNIIIFKILEYFSSEKQYDYISSILKLIPKEE